MSDEPYNTLKRLSDQYKREMSVMSDTIAALSAENERLRKALGECDEYFDNRADADCDQDGYIPNEEMKMLTVVREALEAKP